MLATIIALSLFTITPAAAKVVGQVEYARGVAVAQKADGSAPRLVGRGARLEEGDVVKTSAKSFAVLKLEDGTRMTLRPRSAFTVESMKAEEEEPSAIMRLFRGGLRAITGFISKRNPEGVQLRTPVVTMGVRGTEFDARLCESDCAEENAELAPRQAQAQRSQVIGRVAFARGGLSARAYAGDTRPLSLGGPVYEGDTLETGRSGYAVLALRDQGRITLQPGTEFRVEELRYEESEPEQGSAIMRLVRGGLRAVSGLIGKLRGESYRMHTPVATIGVRGTGYDLLCQGACVSDDTAQIDPPVDWLRALLGFIVEAAYAQAAPSGDGLYAYVWDGAVEVALESGTLLINQNQTVFMSNTTAPPVVLPSIPVFIRDNTAPRPDTLDIDQEELFGGETREDVPPGLYVNVREGHIRLEGDSGRVVDLGRGEAAFTSLAQATPVRLDLVPAFQALDRFPAPSQFDRKAVELIGRAIATSADEELQCEVQ